MKLESIYQPLEFLIYTSVILLIITGVFLIKFLIDLSTLTKSLQDFTRVMQTELEPAIRELKETLVNVNNIAANMENGMEDLNKGVKKSAKVVTGAATVAGEHALSFLKIAGSVAGKGILSGLMFLISRKRK